jgi:hypothetical protein
MSKWRKSTIAMILMGNLLQHEKRKRPRKSLKRLRTQIRMGGTLTILLSLTRKKSFLTLLLLHAPTQMYFQMRIIYL